MVWCNLSSKSGLKLHDKVCIVLLMNLVGFPQCSQLGLAQSSFESIVVLTMVLHSNLLVNGKTNSTSGLNPDIVLYSFVNCSTLN